MFSSVFSPKILADLSASSCVWLSPFNPFNHFAVSFCNNSNLISGFPLMVSCFSCTVEEDSLLADVESLNESMLMLSYLELHDLPCIAPIIAISDCQNCQNINYITHMKSSGGLVGR